MFLLLGSVFPSPLKAVYNLYPRQVEPVSGLRISERPAWASKAGCKGGNRRGKQIDSCRFRSARAALGQGVESE